MDSRGIRVLIWYTQNYDSSRVQTNIYYSQYTPLQDRAYDRLYCESKKVDEVLVCL